MSLERDPASREPWPVPKDTRKLCTCDGAGRGPGRPCVVKAGGRLGDLWQCAEGHAPQRVTMPGPEPLTEVITWVPVEQSERPDSGETVALMFDDGSWTRGYCDEAGAIWYDADTCGQVSGFKWWARVKGPQS